MTERDQPIQHDRDEDPKSSTGRANDDRRGEVRPNDRPVPRSPEPEEDSVRRGQAKLDRVKPY